MATSERIVFQPYTSGRGTNLVAGPAVLCRTAENAKQRAEKAMAGGRIVGAHVIRVLEDADAGDYGEPEYLAAFGRVPEDPASPRTRPLPSSPPRLAAPASLPTDA